MLAISQNGVVGIATTHTRVCYWLPMLKDLVVLAFIGQDARHLEQLVNRVYVYQNNKYRGSPFQNRVAYVEASLWDLLGQATDRSVSQLMGGAQRTEMPTYLSSVRQDTTPQEEINQIGQRLVETKVKAVKMIIGGRIQNNVDSMSNRIKKLILLVRKT